MRKYKSVILILIIVIAAIAAGTFLAVKTAIGVRAQFYADGYVLQTAATSDSNELEVQQVQFSQGTDISVKYPSSAVFEDVQGTKTVVDEDNFVFYNDGSISALKDGLLLTLDDVSNGMVNNYYLASKMVLQSDGSSYTIDNNGNELTFSNFIWKISDSKYLVYSQEMDLTIAGEKLGSVNNAWYLVEYVSDDIVKITDGTDVWQKTATDAGITLNNGISVNLSTREILNSAGDVVLGMDEMQIDSSDNVAIESDTANNWVAPTFNFNVTNGEDGTDGDEGTQGEEGQTGTDGEAGNAGNAGNSGNVGESGKAGDAGGTGTPGTTGNSSSGSGSGSGGTSSALSSTMPSMQLADVDFDCSHLNKFTVQIVGEADVLTAGSGQIQVIRTEDGEVIWSQGDYDFSGTDEVTVEEDIPLSADTEYRIVVSSGYKIGDNAEGSKDFLSKTFTTSSIGTSLSLDYATTEELHLVIDTKSYSDMRIGTIRYTYKGDDGDDVTSWISSDIALDSSGTDANEVTLTIGSSDTPVIVEYYATESSSAIKEGDSKNIQLLSTEEYSTLKATPSFAEVKVTTNSNYMALSLDNFTDTDQAATSFRYEIYEMGAGESATDALKGSPVKTITSTTTAPVALYTNDNCLKDGGTYVVKAYVVYYDNYVTSEVTGDSATFATYSSGTPIIAFHEADDGDVQTWMNDLSDDQKSVDFNFIYGSISVEKNGVDLAVDATHPLTVLVESGNDWNQTLTYYSLDYDDEEEVFTVPVSEYGLKQDTSYRFAIYGYVGSGEGSDYANTYLGNCAVKTTSSNTLYATLTAMDASELSGQSFGAKLTLLDNVNNNGSGNLYSESGGECSVEMACLDAVEVGLYSGNELLDTAILEPTSEDSSYYDSALCQNYKNAQTYTINASDFDVSSLSGTLTLKVMGGYDYTYGVSADETKGIYDYMKGNYVNKISIEADSVTVELAQSPPTFPDENNAVIINNITNTNVGQYDGSSSNSDLKNDTVVGFQATAKYDNSARLAQCVYYYIYTASDADLFYADSSMVSKYDNDFYAFLESDDASSFCKYGHEIVRIPVSDTSTVESIVVLFTHDKDKLDSCERGTNGTFSYLNPSDNVSGVNVIYLNDQTKNSAGTAIWGRGKHYYVAYKAMLTLTTDTSGSIATFQYPNHVTASYTPGMILKSELDSIPKEDPDIETWLDHTTQYTASWNYQICDPDNTVSNYPAADQYSGGVTENYKDLENNAGKPLIIAGTEEVLSRAPYTEYEYDSKTGENVKVQSTNTAAALTGAAWVEYDSCTPSAYSNASGKSYSGTIVIGCDNPGTNTRKAYLYASVRDDGISNNPYYMCLRRNLYDDGYILESDASTVLWSNEYSKFGGHLFDYYTEEELQQGLVFKQDYVVDGTNYICLEYTGSAHAMNHLLAFRVQLTDKDDSTQTGFITTGYEYDSDSKLVTILVDVSKFSFFQIGHEYDVTAYAVYNTGLSGLGTEFTSDGPGKTASDFLNDFNSSVGGVPTYSYALSTLTGRQYATAITSSNGATFPRFQTNATESSLKRYFVVTGNDSSGTYNVNATMGSVSLDARISLDTYYSTGSRVLDVNGNAGYLNLVYTKNGAKIYQNGSLSNICPVLKKTASGLLTEPKTDENPNGISSIKITTLYPTITSIYNKTGYPSFGIDELTVSTQSADQICSNYQPYIFCEIFEKETAEDGTVTYTRLDNQTDYFEHSAEVTINGNKYSIPSIELSNATSSYSQGIKNLDYGATYQIRYYVLPKDMTGMKMSSGGFNALTGDEIYLKYLYLLNSDSVQTIRDGSNSGSNTAMTTEDCTQDADAPSNGYGTTIGVLAYKFTTPKELTIKNLKVSYDVSGYDEDNKLLKMSYTVSRIYDYFIKMEIYDGDTLVYNHNQLMWAAGYTPYDEEGNKLAATAEEAKNLNKDCMYVWKLNGTEYSYDSENVLNFKGLDIGSDTTYTLKLTTIYNPENTADGIIGSSKVPEDVETEQTIQFVRSDRDVDPVYTISVSSEKTSSNGIVLNIKHQVVDSTYRIYDSDESGNYTVKVYDENNNKQVGKAIDGTTNSNVVTSTVTNLKSSHSYRIEISSPLDGNESAVRKSITRTTVDDSGMSIDTSSATILNLDSDNLQLLMKNSSGLDSITSVDYTIYPNDVSVEEPEIKSFSEEANFTDYTTTNKTPAMILHTSAYLGSYAKGDQFIVIINLKQDNDIIKTIQLEFTKTTG